MKKSKRIFLGLVISIILGSFIFYKGVYAKVYNQSNTNQNLEIGSNISNLDLETVLKDMVNFPNRFAGTKPNAEAGQYIRNYFKAAGLNPYYKDEDSYYHSFYGQWLKCSDYYNISVNGVVENVVGVIDGIDATKAVVISAHFDSYRSPGVLDNATGVSVLLELSKRLSERFSTNNYPIDIVFISFNAEESGVVGSTAFYEDISKRYEQIYNINMDVVGALDKPLAFKNTNLNSEELYRDFMPFLDEYTIPYDNNAIYAADIYGEPLGRSDHVVFQDNGHAAIILGESKLQGYTNTEHDKDINAVDFDELARITDAVEKFIISSDGKMY